MQNAITTHIALPSTGTNTASGKGQLSGFFRDLGNEIAHELQFDTSDSDIFVKKHISGMVIAMFGLILVFLVLSVGVVALFHTY